MGVVVGLKSFGRLVEEISRNIGLHSLLWPYFREAREELPDLQQLRDLPRGLLHLQDLEDLLKPELLVTWAVPTRA